MEENKPKVIVVGVGRSDLTARIVHVIQENYGLDIVIVCKDEVETYKSVTKINTTHIDEEYLFLLTNELKRESKRLSDEVFDNNYSRYKKQQDMYRAKFFRR